MTRWAMVIDLEKCVACQGCSIACRFENNRPVISPEEAQQGRAVRWNDVFPMPVNPTEETGEYPNVKLRYQTRPCMHCENPPCTKVWPVQATYKDEKGLVRQNYSRFICCRLCTVGCPYGVRYFNWYAPQWEGRLAEAHNPDVLRGYGSLEDPTVRPKGIVEKCTCCIHRLAKARARAEAVGRPFRAADYVPACVQTCTGKARHSATWTTRTARFRNWRRANAPSACWKTPAPTPKVIYLQEG